MVNTAKTAENQKKLIQLALAILVLLVLFLLINPGTYTLFKKQFVRNSDRYIEMYAYARTKPSDKKYFILQGNDKAKSFFQGVVSYLNEGELKNIACSDKETLILYENSDNTVKDFLKKIETEELVLNPNTNIQFYAAKIKSKGKSCQVQK